MYFNWTFDGNNVVNQSKLNGALGNYQNRIKIPVGDGHHLSASLLGIEQGCYIVCMTELYNTWNQYYIGILMYYNTSNVRLDKIIGHNSVVTYNANTNSLDTNMNLSSCYLIPFGYW